MSLLMLLAVALGVTAGLMLAGRRVCGKRIALGLVLMLIAGFVWFLSAAQTVAPDVLRSGELPLSSSGSIWLIVFTLSCGIGTLLGGIVVHMPKPKHKGRRR